MTKGVALKTVHLRYHYEQGTWWAESRDLPGFSAAGATFNETRQLAHEGVAFQLPDEQVMILEEASMLVGSSAASGNPVETSGSRLVAEAV